MIKGEVINIPNNKEDKIFMNLETLKEIKPTRTMQARPSSTLTDKEWQNRGQLLKDWCRKDFPHIKRRSEGSV